MDCWRVDSGLVFGMFLIIFNRSKHMPLQICMYPSVAITNHTYTHASDSFRSYVGGFIILIKDSLTKEDSKGVIVNQ